ncbi:MAG: YqgE/AlgH family protein [Muribaculaceae bacterium]|nr:YqgE/AlgH family protein [Muribaculaceae bacterium]
MSVNIKDTMDLNKYLYNHEYTTDLSCGSLLIAEPLMRGDIFSRSVVMILDVDKKQGHLGLVLNKKLSVSLNELIPDMGIEREIPVFSGGPVDQSRLFMLHTLGDLFKGSSELIPGIYVGGSIEDVYGYLMDGGELDGKIRFFLGYSGWTYGQLRGEIDRHIWAVREDPQPDISRLLQGRGNNYWRREVGLLEGDYRSWLNVPRDPILN